MESISPLFKIKAKSKLNTCESLISAIGRWLSVDPLANKYIGWIPYNYCMNEPLGMVDPDGRTLDESGLSEENLKKYYDIIKTLEESKRSSSSYKSLEDSKNLYKITDNTA